MCHYENRWLSKEADTKKSKKGSFKEKGEEGAGYPSPFTHSTNQPIDIY